MHENTICTNANDMRIYARHKLAIEKEHPNAMMKRQGNRKDDEEVDCQALMEEG